MTKSGGIILQSVNVSLRNYLIQQGWQAAAMGAEAILDLPWRGKRSVRELARRGRRHGSVQEVENTCTNQAKLAQLIEQSPSRQGVQLKHIERPDFNDSTRLFVFESADQQWLGGVTISVNTASSAHTELLIRHQDAPVGVMEALTTAIAQQLTCDGFTQLSLGNVLLVDTLENKSLFAQHYHPNEVWLRSQMMFKLSKRFDFAYNSSGLWKFKNKFSPRWEPLYLMSSKRISMLTVAEMIHATGYPKLVWNRLLKLEPTHPKNETPQTEAEAVTLS
ncbi:MAG: phosphatidylglycerol lysyltransferase domain-containing protein [Chloroflexota bacterium]